MKIVYVTHPCTTEQKKEILASGFDRVLDARFAPEGADIIDLGEKAEPVKKTRKPRKKAQKEAAEE